MGLDPPFRPASRTPFLATLSKKPPPLPAGGFGCWGVAYVFISHRGASRPLVALKLGLRKGTSPAPFPPE